MNSFFSVISTFWLISTVYSKAIIPPSSSCLSLPPQPINGFMECTLGNEIGSLCYFYCNEGYTLNGAADTLCFQESTHEVAQWDFPTPVCNKQAITTPPSSSCPSLPPQPDNGFMECTFDTEIGSLCSFFCNEGYTLDGAVDTLCVQDSTQKTADWDFPTPACIAQTQTCTDDQKADVIIAIDSSVPFGYENFEIAKDFTENFIRSFSMETNVTRFSVLRYNNGVDTDSQILLRDSDDREQLLHEVQEIPNIPEGDSNIGNALRHIHDVIQTEQNGDRSAVHNIVILFTGSLSNDDVTIPAQQLRTDSDIFIVGMNHLEPSLEYINQMKKITGSAQDVILIEPGQDAEVIDEALSRRIEEIICRN